MPKIKSTFLIFNSNIYEEAWYIAHFGESSVQ